jgi:tetratricopeptide (TPR) repeat protein
MRRLSFLATITLVAASAAAAGDQSDCHNIGDVDLRIRSCSELIQREPNNAPAYNSRAAAYVAKGDYNSAVADVVRAGELAPKKKPQAIVATAVPRTKAAPTPREVSAPAKIDDALPAWAQALFGKSAPQE